MVEQQTISLVDSRHPGYLSGMTDWRKWRLSYDGGDEFREVYLEKFSSREDQTEFNARKAMTPIPKFAGAAINDIRNAIYQRMRDITRKGGSKAYQYAVNGMNLGVDHRGSTMNAFIGVKVLTELLVMGRVGVFVDAPAVPSGATLADVGGISPYLYKYDIEDILSWTCSTVPPSRVVPPPSRVGLDRDNFTRPNPGCSGSSTKTTTRTARFRFPRTAIRGCRWSASPEPTT